MSTGKKKCGGRGKDFRSRSPEFLSDLVKMQEIKTEANFHHKFSILVTNGKLGARNSWIQSDRITSASL